MKGFNSPTYPEERNSNMTLLKRIKIILDKTVDITVITLMAAMVILAFLQVVSRYIFANPPSWTEELARYISVWVIFLASAIAFRTSAHLGVDFFVGILPAVPKIVVKIVINLLLIVTLIVIGRVGISMVDFVSRQLSPAMRMPMSLPYAAIPVGCFLMSLEVLVSSLAMFPRRRAKS